MIKRTWLFRCLLGILMVVTVRCSQNTSIPSPVTSELVQTAPGGLRETSDLLPTLTLTEINTNTPEPTSTNTQTPAPSPPCSSELCTYPGHFWLERPIPSSYNEEVDFTYRYGSTQGGNRPTHHGVEFVNDEGTPVVAAASGLVVVAGNDYQEPYADFPFYYGNLVIIEHHFPEITEPVFTLYGHLSDVQTQVGVSVKVGDQIGAVGYTGVAEWSHLHFEVRVGENIYRETRNPELWLKPHQNDNGDPNGAIAGRIIDEYGAPIYVPSVVVQSIGPNGEITDTIYVETYADFTVNGDDEWGENFVVGDLPPGRYMVSFVARGLQEWKLEVYPGQLTVLVFDAGGV
jgi:murein DD-endopeptidase MepM/ murein hydrolase activator NlpD